MITAVELVHTPAIPLAIVRKRARGAALGAVVPQACGEVWSFVRAHKLQAGRNVAVYLNDTIDLEIGVELLSPLPPNDQVFSGQTPAGLTASAVLYGPYAELAGAHEAIVNWCRAHGYRRLGPRWEIYGHWQGEWNTDPQLIRTDLFYAVVAEGPG